MKPHVRLKVSGTPRADAAFFGMGGGAFRGASQTARDVREWQASSGSADSDLLPDLPELQYRSRDIRRNNGFAHSIVETQVENVVGSGLRFSAEPDYLALAARVGPQFTKDWADEWGQKYEGLFHEWWWSTACHAGDTLTGDMLTEVVLYSKFDNGGSITLPMWIPDRGDGFATKLRVIEIDRLSNPNNAPNTTNFRGGIEYDDDGMPLRYHFRTSHPGDQYFMMPPGGSWMQWASVPRRTPFGRLRVIHDFDSDRADQTRGKPLFSPVLDQFKNLDRYVKAEIQAALMNAMIWGAITTPLDREQIEALFEGDEEKYLAWRDRYSRSPKMEAGTLATLFPGDQLEPFMPTRPATQFGTFVKNVEQIIAVGTGIPHIIAKKEFSESNYSNTRAAMLEAWRTFNRRRDRLGAGWLDPINALFMEEMVNAGRIDAPDYYANRRAYQRGTWIGPGRGYVDKTKEITGDLMALDGNIATMRDICAEQGRNWREQVDQRATERAYLQKRGLPSVSVKSVKSSTAGNDDQQQAPDPNNPDDNPPPAKQQAHESFEVTLGPAP